MAIPRLPYLNSVFPLSPDARTDSHQVPTVLNNKYRPIPIINNTKPRHTKRRLNKYTNWEGSGGPAHTHSLTRAFTVFRKVIVVINPRKYLIHPHGCLTDDQTQICQAPLFTRCGSHSALQNNQFFPPTCLITTEVF